MAVLQIKKTKEFWVVVKMVMLLRNHLNFYDYRIFEALFLRYGVNRIWLFNE